MKRAWTKSEKWLWAAPLLLGVLSGAVLLGKRAVARLLGWPQSLMTTPDNSLRSMALSQNGDVLAAGGVVNTPKGWKRGSGTVYLWNARTGQRLPSIAPIYIRDKQGFTHGYDIYALKLSPDGKQIGFSRVLRNWTLYDVATKKQLWYFPGFVSDAEFSRDGRFIALSSYTHMSIVRASDGKVSAQWKHAGGTNSHDIAWSPDGNLLASIGTYEAGGPVEVHQLHTGKLVRRIRSPKTISGEGVGSVNFSPDGKKLLAACFVGSTMPGDDFSKFAPLRCYAPATGKLLWATKAADYGRVDLRPPNFCDAVFSPDGRTVAAYEYRTGQIFCLRARLGQSKPSEDWV